MAIKIPTEITRDNVFQVCDELNREARKIKRKLLTRRLVLIVGCLSFVAISLLFYLGTMYHFCSDAEKGMVDTVPLLGALSAAAEKGMFSNDLPVVRLCIALAVLQYMIPVGLCALISVLVALAYHPAPAVEAVEEPTRAHQLRKAVNDIYNDWIHVTDGSKFRVVCNYIFTLCCAGTLLLFMVKSEDVKLDFATILGGVVVFVLLHLIYKLLLAIYVSICKWFYGCKNPTSEQLRTAVNAYLRQVDPKAMKEEESTPAAVSAAEPASSRSEIIHIDSFTWTVEYVRANEEKCGDTAMSYVEVAKEFLRDRDYSGAANSLDHAAYALNLLSKVPGGARYMPYVYANQYAASRVYAFGLGDRSAAKFRLEQAVTNAGEFALKQLPGYETAIRDFKVMNGVLEEFNNGTSMSTLREYYGTEFPYDIIG